MNSSPAYLSDPRIRIQLYLCILETHAPQCAGQFREDHPSLSRILRSGRHALADRTIISLARTIKLELEALLQEMNLPYRAPVPTPSL